MGMRVVHEPRALLRWELLPALSDVARSLSRDTLSGHAVQLYISPPVHLRGAGDRARAVGCVCSRPGARRALSLFPRHFPVTFQQEGQFRGGPCPRPVHKGPAQPPPPAVSQSRPIRATMRGARLRQLLGETLGLTRGRRRGGGDTRGTGPSGARTGKVSAPLPAPQSSYGSWALMDLAANLETKREKLRHGDTLKGVTKPAWCLLHVIPEADAGGCSFRSALATLKTLSQRTKEREMQAKSWRSGADVKSS